ncbi:hypothetical protein CB0940_00903 [Cercospora beticola]|uniref:Uncharacterized protein n=1 Tax=Cercospora beticola TaxID=122368 RepID=A0A2G5IAP3_CERBT|nr:hypothetical protein CB0940_00903 [Cercospora beticola]PIB01865.1 hypothetical protein CB0940_00903 [Cercospora beticola]WPA96330.1 hypothetical protein RHO25_000937 [Cercospora beticola]
MVDGQGAAETLATYHEYIKVFEQEERAWRLFLDSRFNSSIVDSKERPLGHQLSCRRDRHALPPSVAARGISAAGGQQKHDTKAAPFVRTVEYAALMGSDRSSSRTEVRNEVEDDAREGMVWIVRKRSIAFIKNAITKRVSLNNWRTRPPTPAMESCRTSRLPRSQDAQEQEMPPRRKFTFSGTLFGHKVPQQQEAVLDFEMRADAGRHAKRRASRALSDVFAGSTEVIVKRFRRKGGQQDRPQRNTRNVSAKTSTSNGVADMTSAGKNERPSRQANNLRNDDSDSGAELSGSDYTSALEELQPLLACPSTRHRTSWKNDGASSADERRLQIPITQPAQAALTPKNYRKTPAQVALYGRKLVVAVEREALKGDMNSGRISQRFDRIYQGLVDDDAAHQESVQRQYLAVVEAEKHQRDQEHQAAMRAWERKGRPVVHSWRCGVKARGNSAQG